MEGYPSKVQGDTFDLGNPSQHFGSAPAAIPSTQPVNTVATFIGQSHSSSGQLEGNTGVMATPGTSLQDDFRGETSVVGNTGRKKKKKQKSGEETLGNSVKPDLMEEDELVDAAIPMLTENQGVEELLYPASLPPAGGTLVGGQYLLNNTLLDQILAEKKMQLMQSPEVMEFLKKQIAKK
ncbi:uncharacterized protein LOC122263571 [Penaeus japonicus]|uniref:uncharacterized protein LOC122263571 n=1 Tax=Penaeus japonicus TaxID=27405 RepID=UPI001C7122D6|nr:uncharacterized protein LOC122263571 [Penaeus japonicus]XP_042887991.1 uncharacterized protein LOC122263571 [Penaeus japonicus]XP_042887992.1 uncharacterized protein LOC122263571 [Penaeus japonicus]XP_042887994.1 uncharacterized protein LOC122263571 [Penaeus japonicus]